jgi:uncharacterized membrane protein YhiD involved in acid resistance
MFQDFQSISLFPVSAADVLGDIVVALLCGILLAIIYRITYKGPSYSVSFVNALVLLTAIAALVLIVIGNNIARAFGLVGAMSIIRFRTAVRDTMDMVFIFLALAIGMACGVGLRVVAILGTLLSGLMIMGLTFSHFGSPRRRFHLLQITYDALHTPNGSLDQTLSKYCRNQRMVNLRNTGQVQELEAFYHVTLKKAAFSEPLVKQLQSQEGIRQVNLFFDEDDVNAPTY